MFAQSICTSLNLFSLISIAFFSFVSVTVSSHRYLLFILSSNVLGQNFLLHLLFSAYWIGAVLSVTLHLGAPHFLLHLSNRSKHMPFGQEGKTAAVLAFEHGDEDAYMCLSLLIAARVNLEGVDLHDKSDVSCGGIVSK